jgi:carbonic anhydrase
MNLRRDLPASIVVFLVAVPLSLGIALASNAPIAAGLIGAVVGGIITGILAGAPLQVSGPAAGLTVVVAGMVGQFGWETMCLITACAGIVQLAAGYLKVARGALIIAPSVVHGMLAGIGISIALAQMHVVLGGKPLGSPIANLLAFPSHLSEMNPSATALGALTFTILVLWKQVSGRLRSIPGPLVAVLVTTGVSLVVPMDVTRVDLPDSISFTRLALPGDWSFFQKHLTTSAFAIAVLTVALVASVESLLCAVATDKLHNRKRCDLDRELVAQGAGNLVSGLLGGLPITGVIVRSSANLQSGAETRWSTVFHGVWILLLSLFFAQWVERVPLCVLAGLLVHVGIHLVNVHHIRELTTHRQVKIYWATVLGVTCINLLAGVALGVVLTVISTLRRLSTFTVHKQHRADRWHVRVQGTLTFASVPKLNAELSSIPRGAPVAIELAVDFIDHAAFESLHSWRMNHEKTGGVVEIDEIHEGWYASAAGGTPRTHKTLPGTHPPV